MVKIEISQELKSILEEIKTNSVVAELLLQEQHNLETVVDEPVNFISISREDSTKISYLTKERMSLINPAEFWTSSRRFQAKPGAFLSKVFRSISSRDIEKFSNAFISQVRKPKFSFEVVSGDIIKDYYHFESYAAENGSLGASCMKHDACQKFLDIYTKNPDMVKMLVMLAPGGSLLGRALLWNFDSYKIMDRIYTVSDEMLQLYFKQWADKNAYLYKREQNWFMTCNFEGNGKHQELKLEVKLPNWSFDYYPYMDTFKFINIRTGTLYNYMAETPHLRTLCASEGNYYDGDYLRWDGIDRCCRYSGDVVWVDYKGIYTHPKNCEWSETNDQYILRGDYIWDDSISDYIFKDSSLNIERRLKDRKLRYSQSQEDCDLEPQF